jgi:cytoskeletal protein RodZ
MTEEIKKVGVMFKTKRKELNLSLKEVENATSIRMNHIEAIEEGREKEFLSPIYLFGFIRQYANFLGLDGDKIVKDNSSTYSKGKDDEKQEFLYGIGTLEVRSTIGGGVKWIPNLAWAIISVVMIVSTYYLAKYFDIF